MSTIEKDRMLQFRGQQLVGGDGEQIGLIEEIYLDADSGEPEWALVHTGLFGSKRTFVPISGATDAGGELRVPLDKATVKDAPQVEPDGLLSTSEEEALYRHYGLEYSGDV